MSVKNSWKAIPVIVIKSCRLIDVATDVSERLLAAIFSVGHTVVKPTTIIVYGARSKTDAW